MGLIIDNPNIHHIGQIEIIFEYDIHRLKKIIMTTTFVTCGRRKTSNIIEEVVDIFNRRTLRDCAHRRDEQTNRQLHNPPIA